MQDLANLDLLVYNDTIVAMGLIQHIREPTHQLGNTFNLIYTESLEVIKVLHTFLGNYILDHRLAGIELQLRKLLGIAERACNWIACEMNKILHDKKNTKTVVLSNVK